MARKKSSGKKGRPRKFNITKSKTRSCDKCHNIVADGHDMYRFHRTGLTVCKSCWITIDPSSRSNRSKVKVKRREQNQTTETKLCTVFLKDVLNEKTYKAESGKDDNKLYIISEDSSQDEDRSESVSPKVKSYTINGSARRGRKRRVDATKSNDETSIKSGPRELRGNRKRLKEVELLKASSDTEQPSTSSLKQRGRKPRAVRHSDRNSDSDIVHLTAGKPSNLVKRHHPSSSDAEDTNKKKKNKRRPTLEKEDLVVNVGASEPSDELSSNEGGVSLRKTKSRNPSITSVASTSKTEIENKRETRRRTRLSSISSKEMTPPTEFKSPKSVTSEVETEYHCDKCNKKFDSKLLSAEHRLTHLKQATLKLEKINILNDEQKKMKIDTEENETFKETEVHSNKNITDKQDLSEEIAINVEDDTDDEEFSLSTNENARQMEKKEKHNEGSDNNNANDKSDTTENISPTLLSEESVKIQNEDKMITEESQQCEDSTSVLDSIDTVILSDKEENENIDDIDAETVKSKNIDTSKDDSSQEVTVATVENNADLKINRNEVTTADNNTEIIATEKETITECNNDKEIFDIETACDNKTIESATLTITKNNNDNINKDNKDDDKKIMDDLGNSCKDNENETIQNVEFCDLTNDSQTKDTKELEKKKDTTDSVNNLETLKDTKVINDVIADEEKVENPERYQNRIDEQNKEIEMIVHVNKSSTLEDFVKSNMSNCKKVNKTKDNTDGDDIAILSDNDDIDNDDTSRSKKVTKEASTMNDLTEKKEWIGNKNEFQQLFENDVSKKREVQENTNHSYSDNNSTNTASEILKEVFDLAAAEVQKRENINNTKSLSDETEMETLENISREIRNSADMPSLDPIVMEVDDDDDVTLT